MGCVLLCSLFLNACTTDRKIEPGIAQPPRKADDRRDNGDPAVVKPPNDRSPSGGIQERRSTRPPSGITTRSDVDEPPVPQVAAAGPTVKTIPGYKTPAEYFIVPSENYPEGVAVVTLPKDYSREPHKTYPMVIAFGGAGECARPPRDGAMAWMHYYKTDEAVEALADNELREGDFRNLVVPAHLDEFNQRLQRNPYQGIILVCPSSPPLSFVEGGETSHYESYIMHDLIPSLKKHYRVAPGRLGIDGVSMGGSRSMYYGFKYPDVFSSIGAVQGAVGPYLNLFENLIDRNKDTLKKCSIQLVTSDGDYLAGSVKKMHRLLLTKKIPHTYYMLTGPHDYIFNQGPGALALLVFHNDALNGKRTGPVR
ncbi:MAG: alpha/beta hydrolase-fold protein [Pseudomonadota bacterium]